METKIQAWEFTKPDSVGGIVYSSKLALDKVAEGYNVEILAITRYRDGRPPKIERGVVL